MFCTNCGAQIADNSQFCTQCGMTFWQEPASQNQTQMMPTKPPSNKRGVLIAILVVLIVILIGVIVLFVVNPFASNENSGASSSATTSETAQPTSEETATQDKSDHNATPTAPEESSASPTPESTYTSPTTTPFYGIWIGAFTEKSKADAFCSETRAKGLNAEVFLSSQWTNLNQEPYWVVTAMTLSTQQLAERQLMSIQSLGYTNAYVKYSGDYKG